MSQTAADVLIECLIDWGVDTIFGLPGDGINGIMEALRVHDSSLRFIQVRHEEAAAFMATGYAKVTGKLGVCLATSGPGGIHLLNGLYDAKMDGAPVLAITGMQAHDLLCTFSQQDVELDKLFQDVSVYNARIMGPNHVENVVDLACRSALSFRGVAHVTFPVDFQSMPLKRRMASERNVAHHTSHQMGGGLKAPNLEDINHAAEILNSSEKVAILVGRGALHARDEVEKVAHILGAPVIKALLGKAVLPDDSPYTTGGIGLLGTRPSQEALENCEALLLVGTSFPYIEFYPKPGKVRAIQIDSNPSRIGLRFPAEVGIVSDSSLALQMLIPQLTFKENRNFLADAQNGMHEWKELMLKQATREEVPMKPQVIAWELGKQLNDDAIVVSDSGTITSWWARHVPVKKNQIHTLSGNLATMACGLPYAIAAQIAYPGRQVVAFVGDGGLSMLMAEIATCVKYNLPVKIVVIKNNTLGQIKWEQMVFLGNPEFACDLQPINFAKVAEACGAIGITVDDPRDCESVVKATLKSFTGPVVLEATVDPFEPPMPAKITLKQAEHFAESMIRGEPYRKEIITTVFADKVREMI